VEKEKRLIRFLLASSLVMLAFLQIQQIRNPPQPEEDPAAELVEGEVNEDAFAQDAGANAGALADNEAKDADAGAAANDAADVEPAGEVQPVPDGGLLHQPRRRDRTH